MKISEISLKDERFGSLVAKTQVIGPRGFKVGRWLCECDCGNVKEMLTRKLLSGERKSCGCNNHPKGHRADITNMVFGGLTAKYPVTGEDGSLLWFCECECGGSREVSAARLNSRNVKSCGCYIKNSPNTPDYPTFPNTSKYQYTTVNGEKDRTHRVIGAKALGRKLLPTEVVHHIDLDRANNENSNLLICTNSYHSWLHGQLKLMKKKAKLNVIQVQRIKEYLSINLKVTEIAKMFNINNSTVYSIKNNKTWGHVVCRGGVS